MLALETPLADLDWIPRNRLTPLARLGLSTLRDLIEHYPRRYEDRRHFRPLPRWGNGAPVCLLAWYHDFAKAAGGWRRMFDITFENEPPDPQPAAVVSLVQHAHIQKMIAVGQSDYLRKAKKRGRQIVIDHPELETVEDDEETQST